jgi:hypothetical protein
VGDNVVTENSPARAPTAAAVAARSVTLTMEANGGSLVRCLPDLGPYIRAPTAVAGRPPSSVAATAALSPEEEAEVSLLEESDADEPDRSSVLVVGAVDVGRRLLDTDAQHPMLAHSSDAADPDSRFSL